MIIFKKKKKKRQHIYLQERLPFLIPLKKRPKVLNVADVVIAVAIDTMYLLFESVNQISDVESFFLEKHIDRCL